MRASRVQEYLEIVPLPLLIGAAVLGLLAFLLVPRNYRLGVSIAFMVVWQTVGALPDLGSVQALAKATSAIPLALIGLSAFLHPGPRRQVSAMAFIFPVMAVIAVVYVLTTEDRTLALAIRFGWIVLTIAALLTVRTIVDDAALRYVIRWLTIGLCIAVLFPASAVVLDPAGSFRGGLFRLFPWGANPEGIGTLFISTTVFTAYLAYRSSGLGKVVLLPFLGISLALGLMTASRAVLLGCVFTSLPVLLAWTRRPIFLIIGVAVVLGPALYLIGLAEQIDFARLGSLKSGRWELYGPYLEVIAERPFFGLIGTQGESFFLLKSVGAHPHNAYLNMLYLGGLSYAIPMMFGVGVAVFSAIYCLVHRRRFLNDPLLITTLAVLLLFMYAHGFVNDVVFYPTFPWSFIHVTVASLLMTAASDMRLLNQQQLTHAANRSYPVVA